MKKSGTAESWHKGADTEINLYARSLQKAALSLARTLEPQPSTGVCPIIWLYRQALKLQLKAVVGEGSNFLKSITDRGYATQHVGLNSICNDLHCACGRFVAAYISAISACDVQGLW